MNNVNWKEANCSSKLKKRNVFSKLFLKCIYLAQIQTVFRKLYIDFIRIIYSKTAFFLVHVSRYEQFSTKRSYYKEIIN